MSRGGVLPGILANVSPAREPEDPTSEEVFLWSIAIVYGLEAVLLP